jgi:hypothetical protein
MAQKIEIGYELMDNVVVRKYFVEYEYVVLCDIPCLDLNEMSESEIEDALIALFKATEKYNVEIGLWDDVHVFDMPYNCVIASTKPIPRKVIKIAISTLRAFCGGDGNE